MPVVKTKSGYRYGKTGKVYKSKAKAVNRAKPSASRKSDAEEA